MAWRCWLWDKQEAREVKSPVLCVQLGGGVGRYMGSGSKRKINMRVGEDVLSRLWSRVQTNNGIMVCPCFCLLSFGPGVKTKQGLRKT